MQSDGCQGEDSTGRRNRKTRRKKTEKKGKRCRKKVVKQKGKRRWLITEYRTRVERRKDEGDGKG